MHCLRTLRDEYDKLENLLRIKGIDPDEFLNQNKNNNGDDDDDENASECSECSCDECCEEDCCDEKTENPPSDKAEETLNDQAAAASSSKNETQQPNTTSSKNTSDEHNKRSGKDRLNVKFFFAFNQSTSFQSKQIIFPLLFQLNFDHLSVVSEENSEGTSMIQNEDSSIPIHDISAFLHNVDVLSPLSYLQKLNPPLAHFENLNYEQIGGSNVGEFE